MSHSQADVCWQWAASWFGDYDVCDRRDKIGFVIGLISVLCWGLAEVPQLIVNFLEGSSEGISEGLLWLWLFSDVLDVVGCTISDTLPTMVITAWMYFIFTVLLMVQHVYYTRFATPAKQVTDDVEGLEVRLPLLSDGEDDLVADLYGPAIVRQERTASGTHTVYGSLRNLSLRRNNSSSNLSISGTGRQVRKSFVESRQRRQERQANLAVRPATADAALAAAATRSRSLPKSFSGTAAAARMIAGLTLVAVATCGPAALGRVGGGNMGRGLLSKEPDFLGLSQAAWGEIMGWTMAVTFFCGRVPQVIKNWQRQSCAGLSLEMFAIVLTAAVTYCASIVVRVRSWEDLQPKLPFLVDAALGAILDLVILLQFFIYKDVDGDDGTSSSSAHDGQQQQRLPSACASGAGGSAGCGALVAFRQDGGKSQQQIGSIPKNNATFPQDVNDANLQRWDQLVAEKERSASLVESDTLSFVSNATI